MRLIGAHDLQARSAYQPLIVKQGDRFIAVELMRLDEMHKNWWDGASGIGYLVSDGRPQGWRTNRMTKIYDLGDPARPRLIRDSSSSEW